MAISARDTGTSIIGAVWRRFPDTREIIAHYPGTCIGCDRKIAIGDPIVGTKHDGWVCPTCAHTIGQSLEPTPWAVPVGAHALRLRYSTQCCHCGSDVAVGSEAWPNIMGGWSCAECKNTVPPTWIGVLTKAANRIAKRKPLNLSLADYATLLIAVKEQTSLVPTRRGAESDWSQIRRRRVSAPPGFGGSAAELSETYGLLTDAVEHRFNPNLSTDQFFHLARVVEDPDSQNRQWDEVLHRNIPEQLRIRT